MNTINDNAEGIYDDDIYQEELYGILEDTERYPNYRQEKDKQNHKDTEEGNDTQDMQMDHPDEYIIINDNECKTMTLSVKKKCIVQEYNN